MPVIKEPIIIINGQKLIIGQSMTIRVALTSFIFDLKANGLGEDKHGKIMTKNYLKRIDEIQNIMSKNRSVI